MTHKASYPKIVVVPPGPRARELLAKDVAHLSQSSARYYPLVVESGSGCIVRDVDGNEYIDFNSGLGALVVGHSNPKILETIYNQSQKLIHYSSSGFYYPPIINLAEKLTGIAPGGFKKKVFFSNSGSEAIEAAIKLCKWHTRNHLFLAFTNAFHGRTLGSLSLTANSPVQRRHFSPLMPGVTHVPFPYCYRCPFKLELPGCDYWCVGFIEEEVFSRSVPVEDVAAFIIEPIQGEGGCIVPPPGYFERLKKLLDSYGLLLVDDEAQTGIGRTGKWFAVGHWNITPDIVCTAGGLASGMPIGATIGKTELMDWEKGSHASTFGGNPVACMIGLQTIAIIEEDRLLENAARQGSYIISRLNEMRDRYEIIGDIRGKGLMIGVEIVKNRVTKEPGVSFAMDVMMKCFRRGLALTMCAGSTIKLMPPLIVTRELVDHGLEILEGVIREVSSS